MVELTTNRRRFMGGIAFGSMGGFPLGQAGIPFADLDADGLEAPHLGRPPDGMFLAVSNIEGSAQHDDHRDEIDVLAWQFGVSRSADQGAGRGAGRTAARPAFDALFVGKHVDKATPLLLRSCVSGTHHDEAVLSLLTATETSSFDYLTVTLRDVEVTSAVDFGTSEFRPTEEITLTFDQVEVAFTEQLPTGEAGDTVTFGWDVGKNAPIETDQPKDPVGR